MFGSEHNEKVVSLAVNDNDTIKAYAVSTLKELNSLNLLDKDAVLSSIKDANLKAIVENCFI